MPRGGMSSEHSNHEAIRIMRRILPIPRYGVRYLVGHGSHAMLL